MGTNGTRRASDAGGSATRCTRHTRRTPGTLPTCEANGTGRADGAGALDTLCTDCSLRARCTNGTARTGGTDGNCAGVTASTNWSLHARWACGSLAATRACEALSRGTGCTCHAALTGDACGADCTARTRCSFTCDADGTCHAPFAGRSGRTDFTGWADETGNLLGLLHVDDGCLGLLLLQLHRRGGGCGGAGARIRRFGHAVGCRCL